jgi:hypothetical protein
MPAWLSLFLQSFPTKAWRIGPKSAQRFSDKSDAKTKE